MAAEWLDQFNRSPRAIVYFYVALLVISEFTTFLISPALGAVLYAAVLVALIAHASLLWQQPVHRALLSLTFAPIIRLVSLAVPLGEFPLFQAYAITGVPLIIAAFVSVRSMKLKPREVGLGLGRRPLLQIVIMPTGIVLGFAEYLILRPEPMVNSTSWQAFLVPAVILLICTGFAEEFMFRGIMQETMRPLFGTASIVLVSVLFAALHVGYQSALDLLIVLVAGLMFGVVAYRSHSIWGVTVAHGLTNIVLFLICPAVAAAIRF
ncbi:MAG: type II CAAX endopeptidase family protein [Anaerolineae bacterium]